MSVPPARPHKLAQTGVGLTCLTCGQHSATRQGQLALRRATCKGMVLEKVAKHALRKGAYVKWLEHAVVYTKPLFWCLACGAYTKKHLRNLATKCPGHPRNVAGRSRLKFLREGRHPVGGLPLEKGGRLQWCKWQQILADALGQ